MPVAIVKKVAEELGVPESEIEEIWDKAKAAAEESEQGENYAYIMRIFQTMIKNKRKE